MRRGRVAGHPYLRYGRGDPLVVVPGLNDPLLRVDESLPFTAVVAAYCRRCARAFDRATYYVSRPPGGGTESTREMAAGYADVLDALGSADVLGLSMGGFVGQHLAADYPDRVRSLACGLAAARLSPRGRRRVRRWLDWADDGAWGRIYHAGVDAVSEGPVRVAGHLVAAGYARFRGPPTVPRDFRTAAEACLAHEATDRLASLDCPAVVVGGTRDPFFAESEFRETAEALDCPFVRLAGVGHEAVIHHPGAFDRGVGRVVGED